MVATVDITVDPPSTVPEAIDQELVYTLSRDETEQVLVVKFQLSGEATYEIDYLVDEQESDTVFLPENPIAGEPVTGTAVFYPGESTVELIVSPLADALEERDEDIVITVQPADEFGPVLGAATQIIDGDAIGYYAVDSENRLAVVDTETGLVSTLGTVELFGNDRIITDIAFTEDGNLFAITNDRLFELDLESIADDAIPARFLGFHGVSLANALVDSRDGDFGSESGDLFAVGQFSLDLQHLDLEEVDGQFELAGVATVFEIDVALNQIGQPFNYISSGDLDYVSSGDLILSVSRPQDAFDSLVEIETPGQNGVIDRNPVPATDPNEDFTELYGLSFYSNSNFAFSGRRLLEVNRFNLDVSHELELTGVPYMIGPAESATGMIEGDPVPPPTVTLNTLQSDPADLGSWAQPTSWNSQRSELSDIVIQLGAAIDSIPVNSVTLTNLGVQFSDAPSVIALDPTQIVLQASGDKIVIELNPGQLPDGRYQLELSGEITYGDVYTFTGDAANRFYQMRGDWNGSGFVDILDFETFAYWFGQTTTVAPAYVDLNGSGEISQGDFPFFRDNYGRFIQLPGVSDPIDSDLVDEAELTRALASAVQPFDVNGSQIVTPVDALSVINRIARGTGDSIDWRFDANRDGSITPIDALAVINFLAQNFGSREGEMTDHALIENHGARIDSAIATLDDKEDDWLIDGTLF